MMERGLIGRLILSFACASILGCGTGSNQSATEVQRVRSGMLDVVLLSSTGALHHGRDTFVIEFRSSSGGALVDVGTVKASASMSMAGTPMLGSVDVMRTEVLGRYEATSDLSMAGTWRLALEWIGGVGPGSVTISGSIQ